MAAATELTNARQARRRPWWLLVLLLVLLNIAAWQRETVARWLGQLGIYAASQDDADAVARWTAWAQTLDAEAPTAEFALARLARRSGEFEQARRHLQRAAFQGMDDESVELEKTLTLAQSGRMVEVGPALPDLLAAENVNQTEVAEAYAQGYLRLRDFSSALALLKPWSQDFPDDPRPHAWMGLIHVELQDASAAESAFKEALQRDPNHATAAMGLGQLLLNQKSPDEAIPYLRVAVSNPRVGADAAALLSKALRDAGKMDEADAVIAEARVRFPQHEGLLIEQADRWIERGDYQLAVDALKPLVDEGERRREVRYAYAMALRGIGQTEQAAEHFAYATEAAAATAEANRKVPLVSEDPSNAQLRYEIGAAHLKYGNVEDGLMWLLSVLELDPMHRDTHRALADYYGTQLSRRPELIGAYQRHRTIGGPSTLPSADVENHTQKNQG